MHNESCTRLDRGSDCYFMWYKSLKVFYLSNYSLNGHLFWSFASGNKSLWRADQVIVHMRRKQQPFWIQSANFNSHHSGDIHFFLSVTPKGSLVVASSTFYAHAFIESSVRFKMAMVKMCFVILLVIFCLLSVSCLPEPGKKDLKFNKVSF